MKPRHLIWLLSLFLVTGTASAALEFTLSPGVRSGAFGSDIIFVGTLKNTSATQNLFLNDVHFDLNGGSATALTPNGNTFFANVPGILLPNETYSGVIFGMSIGPSASPGDYLGSVTIRGGTDIFAVTDLLAQQFQLSSPQVTISATSPTASEFGPTLGIMTVTRTGASNYDLTVNYTLGGSAVNGVRYQPIAGSIVIPAGATSAAINVAPVPNDTIEGTQTVTATIMASANYNLGGSVLATVAIHDKPIDEWRVQQFGAQASVSQIAGDAADPERDGIVNLAEYGLFLDPNVSSVAGLPVLGVSANHLQLQFRRNTSATDLTYVVEATSDLVAQNWSALMTRTPAGSWTANQQGATALESGAGSFVSVTVTDSLPIVDPNTQQHLPRRFLRLRLQR